MMTRRQVAETFYVNKLAAEARVTKADISKCLDLWEQPHRYYHGFNHLVRLLEEIQLLPDAKWPDEQKEKMELLALFHDVVYDPRKNDNEDKSIEFIKSLDVVEERLSEIFDAIQLTKYKHAARPTNDGYVRTFCKMDIGRSCMDEEGDSVGDVVHREIQLSKEYQFWDFPVYRQKRLDFIDRFTYFSKEFKDQATDFLNSYRPKIGVYAGSFNPFHIGHMNIVEQAEKVFDKVIIAVGNNPSKDKFASPPTSQLRIEKVLPFHQVVHYNTLLSDYLKTLDYADVTLIRGLRSGYDLDYEMNQLRILEDYGCKLPVAYFLCSKETVHVSSSMIRGLAKFENSNVEKYLPKKYEYAI